MTFAAAFSSQPDRALLLPYLMAGVPGEDISIDLFAVMADAGADGFEVGIPYADPLMDGPVIQEAGRRALAAGTTMASGLSVAEEVVRRTGLPAAVMTYVNPVLRVGPERFARALADTGASALIVADLPVDESASIAAACRAAGVGLVQFAAPTTTDERLARVAAAQPPFVYGIAEVGVTGERTDASRHAAGLVSRIRSLTATPIVLGVGIATPEAARSAAAVADGVIVGSALVRRVLEAEDASAAAASLAHAVAGFREAMERPVGNI